ncbi:Ger(x)C family spore germination protein [Peribacillus saganii]|uniref:Ger(X)C family spore germination protein n=1 Tax=Peribacillus saganii TaxID=2303992 RepID=A0A372LJT2_9BACI|nr:Ger(x)C family spore germination protein [Peribacillus saganii]RFU66391.1 Ger(x)C family spore germination protein [Peribacillus saganii]
MLLPKRKWFVILIPIMICTLLTGCWDSDEIDDRAVVLAISIDKEEAEKEEIQIAHSGKTADLSDLPLIRISAQIALPGRIPLGPVTGGGGGGDQSPVWVVSVNGHTIDEAMLNLQQQVADELFLGHLRIIVVSEEIAREGVNRFMDYLKRNPEIRRTAWMVVSEGKADKFMKMAPQLERVPALYLSTVLDDAVDIGKFPSDFIGTFWSILSSNAQDAYLPYLNIKNKENVQIKGVAYFKGDKMIGKTNPLEIGLFMGILGEEKGGYGTFVDSPEIDGFLLVRATKRNVKVKTSFKNGRPHVRIIAHYEAMISEIEEDKNAKKPLNPKAINSIEEQFSKGIEKEIKQLIKKTQKDQSDIYGFGEHFRAKEPNYWKENVRTLEDWHREYENLTVQVDCKTDIRLVGMKSK